MVCPNGDYLQIAVLFLGGGIQAAFLRRITVFCSSAAHAAQMTRNSNRMITIRIIKLMPPPP
jgi:hypothetical protein